MFFKSIQLSFISSLLLASNLYADDGFDDENEFGSDEIELVQIEQSEQNDFTLYGSVTATGEYSTIGNSIVSTKLSTNLKLEYIVDEFHKIKSTIKGYKATNTNINNDRGFDINELSVEGIFHNGIDGKIGRQIVVWGKSDNIRITDILNPMDMTTPGMVDIKDLRLGVAMTKLDYFMDKWALSGMVLHENRFSTMAEFGSEYYRATMPDAPSNSLSNSGTALSLSGNLQGEDISFYLANKYVDNTTYKTNMVGFAYNKVMDSFLIKTEVAYFDNYDSNTIDGKTDGLVGVEYNGISDGSISFEVANKNDDIQYALRFTQSYLNQTLDFTTLYSGYGKNLEDGGFARVWFDYAYDDNISTSFGVIDYFGGDNLYFENIKDNDRVFASLTYNF
ncbi:MAG: DUF1302 family protein [Campylobacterota bacterium]|nr:DUF1302 family protein [Campylobacterota bacterium]